MFTLRNVALTVLMFSAFAVGSAASVRADTIVFSSQADFFLAANNLSTETFDQFPAGTLIGVGSATIGGVTYTAQNPLAEWRVVALSVPPSPPTISRPLTTPARSSC